MKKHTLLQTNLLICLVILTGFMLISWINDQTYKTILEDDIENISKLTSSHIYAEIDNELTKPIYVSQTMANDSFLKEWLYLENQNKGDAAYSKRMQDYLLAYKKKYNYDSVFLISGQSDIYYYYEGVNKVVSPENEHDDWYYRFLESGASYRLNIDTDEANQNELTIFVDCRVEAPDGTYLGTTGVGVKMSRLQEMLRQHETDYKLRAFLINEEGVVQADTDSSRIGNWNLFDEKTLEKFRQDILNNRTSMEIHWFPQSQLDHCIITRYIENLDWYLVVQKNTKEIRDSFQHLIQQDILIVAVILALLLSLSTIAVRQYDRILTKALNTDGLTGLPNHRAFEDAFQTAKWKNGVFFLFDIDRFKKVNDTKGHLFGNTVLAEAAAAAKEQVGEDGLIARWGGDEFVGVLNKSPEEAEKFFTSLQETVPNRCQYDGKKITISIGATQIVPGKPLERLTDQADQALYHSKEKGGNCFTIYPFISTSSGQK